MPAPHRAKKSKTGRGRGRPSREDSPQLTRKRVLRAALKLVDDQGIDALSIRKLATELGVAPNSLYWYVRDKDDLLQGVVHLLFGILAVPDSGTGPWTERLRGVCRWFRARLLEHPNVVETASFASTFPFAFAPLSVATGTVLMSAGFGGEQLMRIALTLYYHTIGFVTLEVARARYGFVPLEVAQARLSEPRVDEERLRRFLAADPSGINNPELSDYLALLRDQDMNVLFEYSLDCVLAGLAAEKPLPLAAARGGSAPRKRGAR